MTHMLDPAQRAAAFNAFTQGALAALDRLEIRAVDGDAEREAVHRFRYACYRAAGHVRPCTSRRITDPYDDLPGTRLFTLTHGGRIVSSLRLHVVDAARPRCMSVDTFGDVLTPLLESGARLLDPTRFTIDPAASRAFPALPYLTLRLVVMASIHFGVDHGLSLVRMRHAAFYRRVFGARLLAGERPCRGVDFPVCLLASDVRRGLAKTCRRFPFLQSLPGERAALFGAEATKPVRPTARSAIAAGAVPTLSPAPPRAPA